MSKARLLLVALVLAACTEAAVPTRLPTLTLIPPTATFTPTPVTPTRTPVGLPGPGDLLTQTPEAEAVSVPAQAQPLLARALSQLADQLETHEDAIQLLRLESAVWTSLDLGCGAADLPGSANLEIEGFRIVLLHEDIRYEYHTDNRSSVLLCEGEGDIAGETELLLETDPVAAEMVGLARRRLADDLDLALIRIQIVDVAAYTWTDSSLGCPQPDVTYPSINIGGYRIVLEAGDTEYAFHTDSTQLIQCDFENEQLP